MKKKIDVSHVGLTKTKQRKNSNFKTQVTKEKSVGWQKQNK